MLSAEQPEHWARDDPPIPVEEPQAAPAEATPVAGKSDEPAKPAEAAPSKPAPAQPTPALAKVGLHKMKKNDLLSVFNNNGLSCNVPE